MMENMTGEAMAVPAWEAMTEEQSGRWQELLDGLAGMLPTGAVCVLVDGSPHAAVVADRLAARLSTHGRPCVRLADSSTTAERVRATVTLADGPDRHACPPPLSSGRNRDTYRFGAPTPPPHLACGRAPRGGRRRARSRSPSSPLIPAVAGSQFEPRSLRGGQGPSPVARSPALVPPPPG